MNPLGRLAACFLLAGCVTDSSPSLAPDAAAGVVVESALAFLARPSADGTDARIVLARDLGVVERGTTLEYALCVATEGLERAGIEIVFADGTILPAPRARSLALRERDLDTAPAGGAPDAARVTWTRERFDLDEHVGREIAHVVLGTTGARGRAAIVYVDDVALVERDGERMEIFVDTLAGDASRVDDELGRAACVLVEARPSYPLGWVPAGARRIAEPWALLDLQRATLPPSARDAGDDDRPSGTVYLGAGVPFGFASAAEERAIALRGQRVSFTPLDGGRYYELHLVVEAAPGTTTLWQILGRQGETRPLVIAIPESGPGEPPSATTTLSIPIATGFAIDGLRAPSDPSTRLVAASVRWLREAPVDPAFRREWIVREAPSPLVKRWLANLSIGTAFVPLPYEEPYERRLFDLLLAGERAGFVALVKNRLARFEELAQTRDADRITFVPTFELQGAAPAAIESVIALLEQHEELACTLRSAGAWSKLVEREPAVGARLQALARAGRVELAAARWTAGDEPPIDGETLVRDLVLGVRAARAHGFETYSGDLGGTAGPLAVLPQLWRATGTETLLAPRASDRPSAFRARGADGTMLPAAEIARGRNGLPSAHELGRELEAARVATGVGELVFGLPLSGDAGDARTIAWLESLARTDLAPSVRTTTLTRHLEEIAQVGVELPILDVAADPDASAASASSTTDTIGARAMVAELVRAERFGAVAEADGLSWMRDEAELLWKRVLEVGAGGTGASGRNGENGAVLRERVRARAEALVREELAVLARAANTRGPGEPIIVFNALPWDRSEVLALETTAAGVLDADWKALVVQRTREGALLFRAEVPALGYAVFHLVDKNEALTRSDLQVDRWRFENSRLALEIEPVRGRLRSLKLVPEGLELLAGSGNFLSWNGDIEAPIAQALPGLESIDVLEEGPVRAVVRWTRAYPGVRIVQDLVLTSEEAELDVRTRIEGALARGDLRTNFLLRHPGPGATHDVTFGSASIEASPGDPFGRHALSTWVVRGDESAGIALVSETCKRFGATGTLLSLSLGDGDAARAPEIAPGVREFGFTLIAAGGARLEGAAAGAAAERAHPLIVRPAIAHDGARPARHSFLRLSRIDGEGRMHAGTAASIELAAFKPADDGDGWIVRVREARGEACSARLAFDRSLFSAERVDLLEEPIETLRASGKHVDVGLGPHRVETVRVRTRPRSD